MNKPMQDTTARRMLANKKLVDDSERASFQDIINAIESYIQVITSRKSNALDSALGSLEALESDLSSIIDDVKEVVEGRV